MTHKLGSMFYDALFKISRPFLHKFDAEKAHHLTLNILRFRFITRRASISDPALSLSVFGRVFPNPVGLAAGFDKNAEAIDAMLGFGFGFVEAGTVTPQAQAGHPKPRIFRDPQTQSIINRMGFPNRGADLFEHNYQSFRAKGKNKEGIVGINVGKNKDQKDPLADYISLVHRFGKQSDYIAVNISSPNTPGLRDLQDPDELLPFLRQLVIVRNARCRTPLLVKFAPDLSDDQCRNIAQAAMEAKIDGVILTNTTLDRPAVLPADFAVQTGGLSGSLLHEKSLHIIRRFYQYTNGTLPIVGVGGIHSAGSAYDKIKAGASLVQLYSSLVYQGPALTTKINKGLIELLKADGHTSITQAIGADHR